jgi:hypothetical protein
VEVAICRLHRTDDGQWERALISIDTYPVVSRIIKVGGERPSR